MTRKHTNIIEAADLFCGAGGTSTGLKLAAESLGFDVRLLAINHWDVAIATHTENHADAQHLCQSLDAVEPHKLIPSGRLKLLVASPECTHHSNARGGKPRSDQKRADAWLLMRWIEELYVDNVIIENVKEFRDWGPLGAVGKPLKSKRGEYYREFLRWLRINYNVDERVLNAADYGDATTRERLFVIARRPKHKAIVWPAQTHARKAVKLAGGRELEKWRSAREIIDWTLQGESIFNRKRPLSKNTLARIFAGLAKYSGLPFVLPNEGFYRGNAARSVEDPLPTVTSRGAGAVVECEPFVLPHQHGSSGPNNVRSIDDPLPTVTGTSSDMFVAQPFLLNLKGSDRRDRSIDEPAFAQCTGNHQAVVEPFVLCVRGGGDGYLRADGVDEPLRTITGNPALAVVEPYLVQFNNHCDASPVDEPLGTVMSRDKFGLAEPFLIQFFGERDGQQPRTRPVEDPLWTVTGQGRMGVVQPFIIPCNHGSGDTRSHSLEEPMPTITSVDAWALLQPFLVKFYGGQHSASLDEPLPTITANYEHYGVVRPYLVEYHGNHNGRADGERRTRSLDEPLPTADTSNRFALAQPCLVRFGEASEDATAKGRFGLFIPSMGAILDIKFRMLQPHELAAAMSFPKSYVFTGTREQKVKQIGNAVPVNLAAALCRAVLGDATKPKRKRRAA